MQMKEIITIVRPEKYLVTLEAAKELGMEMAFEQRVLGRGRQGGLRYLRPGTEGQSESVQFLPKRMLSWWGTEERVDAMVEAIIRTNCTSSYGDGKIFICPLDDVR